MFRAVWGCDSGDSSHSDSSTQWVTGENENFVCSLMVGWPMFFSRIMHEAANSQAKTPVCHQLQLVVWVVRDMIGSRLQPGFRMIEKSG